MKDSEWAGEPHVLIVHSVTPPDGQFDAGELDYDIEHPPSCKQERHGGGDVTWMEWACELGWHEREGGLAFCLKYSGTPVTEPGTYRIQSWGRKYYVFDAATYEHDGSIAVIGEEAA